MVTRIICTTTTKKGFSRPIFAPPLLAESASTVQRRKLVQACDDRQQWCLEAEKWDLGTRMDPEGPSSSEEGKSRKSYRHAPLHSLTTWLTFAILAAILFNFLFRDELPSGRQNRLLQSGIWERIVEASLLVSTRDGLSGVCNNDREEPAVRYRWTGWVWEITGWSSRLQEIHRSFYRNL